MAESVNEKAEGDKECLNLLYLATQKQINPEQSTISSRNTLPSSNDDANLASKSSSTLSEQEANGSETSGSVQQQKVDSQKTQMTKKTRRQSSKATEDDTIITQICPKVNCPEKIIICLDISSEMDEMSFRSRAGDKFTPMKLVKRAIEIFLHTKHQVDSRHEFALMFLKDTAYWVTDFTSDHNKIINVLKEYSETSSVDTFDMGSLFSEIHKQVILPKVDKPSVLPPPYIIRAILLYGRSCCVPSSSSRETIFDSICELDVNGLSFVFEVSKNPTRLYDCMAQLLAHPLQRPIQKDVLYNIEQMSFEDPQ